MKKIYLLAILLIANGAYAQTPQLIDWFAGADVVGTSNSKSSQLESDFYVREFELSAFSQIDQTWQGILTLAYHRELQNDDEHFEVHEAFILSSTLLPNATLKLGKIFMGFGRLNRFHRHDWIFTDAPYIQKSLFGNEGAKDTGIEYKRNLLSIDSTLTLGLMSGNEFNHTAHSEEEDDGSGHSGHDHEEMEGLSPTAYLRYAKFIEFSTTEGMDFGFNFINRVSREEDETLHQTYYGFDFIYKDRVGKFLNHLVQAEGWQRKTVHAEDDESDLFDGGFYVFYQKGFDQHHALGARFDYYKANKESSEADPHFNNNIDGISVQDELMVSTLAYTYTNSEFMRLRFSVEYGDGIYLEDSATSSYLEGMAQIVFSIGAHPAHVY